MPKLSKLEISAAIQLHLKAGHPEAREMNLQEEVYDFIDQMEAKLKLIRASRKDLNEVVVPDFICGPECGCED